MDDLADGMETKHRSKISQSSSSPRGFVRDRSEKVRTKRQQGARPKFFVRVRPSKKRVNSFKTNLCSGFGRGLKFLWKKFKKLLIWEIWIFLDFGDSKFPNFQVLGFREIWPGPSLGQAGLGAWGEDEGEVLK